MPTNEILVKLLIIVRVRQLFCKVLGLRKSLRNIFNSYFIFCVARNVFFFFFLEIITVCMQSQFGRKTLQIHVNRNINMFCIIFWQVCLCKLDLLAQDALCCLRSTLFIHNSTIHNGTAWFILYMSIPFP